MQPSRLVNGSDERGASALGIAVILVIAFAILILFMRGCGALGRWGPAVPTSVSINGPATIPTGGSALYTITLVVSPAPIGNQSFRVLVEEHDGWWGWDDDLGTATVTVTGGQTSGTATITLSCDSSNIVVGEQDDENPVQVQVEADRDGPLLPNLRSETNLDVECVPREEEGG